MVRKTTADVVVRSRKKGEKVYSDVERQLTQLTGKVKTYGIVAGAAAVGGVALLTRESFRQIDALAKHADRVGASTIELKGLQLATELTGGSADKFDQIMSKTQKTLGEFAVTGSGTAAPFLRQLKLDVNELVQLDPAELFRVYAAEIRNLGTRAEQAAASAGLFSDRTGQMLNLIDLGEDEIASLTEEVELYGLAMDRVDSAKVEAANDAWLLARERIGAVGNVMAVSLAPFVAEFANQIRDTGHEAEDLGETFDRVIDGIAVGVGIVSDAVFGWQLIFGNVRTVILSASAEIVGAIASVERVQTSLNNTFRDIVGAELLDPEQAFFRSIETSLEASAEHSKRLAQELAASEPPSVSLGRRITQIRLDAEESARAVKRQREELQKIVAPTFDESEIAERERMRQEATAARLRESLRRRLEVVQEGVLQEEQVAALAFLRRQEIIDEAQDAELISEERALRLKTELRQRFETEITKIANKGHSERQKFQELSNKAQAKDVFDTLESITAGVATSSKTLFRINQAAAIANAIINTHEGVTKTLAKYPWPLAGVLAAVHLAAGAARIAAIRSASPGGGTTPSLAGTTPSINETPVPEPTPEQNQLTGANQAFGGNQVTIIVEGSLIGDEGVRTVLRDTLGELADDDIILIPPDSRNAEEIRQGTGSGG